MNLPDALLDSTWVMLAWVFFVPCLIYAARRAHWHLLTDSARLNVFMGLIVLLVLLWNLKAGIKPGLSLHLLGAMVFTLCFGWALAFLGLCCVLAGTSLNGAAGWEVFALNAFLMAGVGVAVSHGIHRLIAQRLPAHFFVYIFANGFFGSGVSVFAVGLASCLLFTLNGTYSVAYLLDEYLPYFILLGFSEAWLSGMVMTLLVIYRPEWVSTFEDKQYLADK
jgi:uncharacterized membrane protein